MRMATGNGPPGGFGLGPVLDGSGGHPEGHRQEAGQQGTSGGRCHGGVPRHPVHIRNGPGRIVASGRGAGRRYRSPIRHDAPGHEGPTWTCNSGASGHW